MAKNLQKRTLRDEIQTFANHIWEPSGKLSEEIGDAEIMQHSVEIV